MHTLSTTKSNTSNSQNLAQPGNPSHTACKNAVGFAVSVKNTDFSHADGGAQNPSVGISLALSKHQFINDKLRGLTPRETCRMHGLPDWFEHDPDTRRALKQAGNALAYPLFRALGTQLAGVLKPRP